MKVLFDTNVVLDVLLMRQPFALNALDLFTRVERGELQGVLGASTLTTIYYLVAKALNKEKAEVSVRQLLAIFEVAAVTRAVIESALEQNFADFEDAVLHEAGRQQKVDTVVTRDVAGFRQAVVPVYTPAEFLSILTTLNQEFEE